MLTSLGSKMVEGATIPLILAALWMITSASLNRPWEMSHRGDSGMNLRYKEQSHEAFQPNGPGGTKVELGNGVPESELGLGKVWYF